MSNELVSGGNRPIDVIKQGLAQLPLAQNLPANISVEKFRNVALTAINLNPDLLDADRASLFTSCMRAASDGLIPDGREGALVVYKTKVNRGGQDHWIKMVQFLPMAFGIMKRMRNSGEIASISVHVAYQNDYFDYELGDNEFISHRPNIDGERGALKCAYAIVKMNDGTVQREVMSKAEIEKIRQSSKSKDGHAWTTWFDQMARKSVLKRISKYLPMSAEDMDFIHREDDDAEPTHVVHQEQHVALAAPVVPTAPPPAASKLDRFEADVEEPPKEKKASRKQKPVVAAPEPKPEPEPEPEPEIIDADYDEETGEVLVPEPEPEPEVTISADELFLIGSFNDCLTRQDLIAFWKSKDSQPFLERSSKDEESWKRIQTAFSQRKRSLPEVNENE